MDDISTSITDALTHVGARIVEYLPNILGAAVLLLAGWLAAWLLSRATDHIARRAAERLAHARQMPASVRRLRSYRSMPTVGARLVFWIVMLFFAAAAVEALGLPAVSNVVSWLTAYLPRMLIAALIVVLGFWGGQAVREIIIAATEQTRIGRGPLLARLAQSTLVAVATVIAAEQVGIDTTVLITLVVILVGTTLGAMALAFALGASGTVANIVAAHYVHQMHRVGERIRIADTEGTITEIGRTAVVLDSAGEKFIVPARRFNEEISTVRQREG